MDATGPVSCVIDGQDALQADAPTVWSHLAELDLPLQTVVVVQHKHVRVSDTGLAVAAELAVRGFIGLVESESPTDAAHWFAAPGPPLHAYGNTVIGLYREAAESARPLADLVCFRPAVLNRRLEDAATDAALGDLLVAHPDWLGVALRTAVR
ncbi:MAG: hypothetical protein D6761_05925 [Candidatus Dadabacteria bacterium]|nr:MAG: hypothetical protein D6761_05925 [Candidatus Dadabacteria bacterium]